MSGADGTRGQSNVVGVAILIGLTMLSLGALTAAVGTVVESNAAAADADRVADDLEAAIQPVETTGRHAGRVSFTDGELRTVDRTIRVADGDSDPGDPDWITIPADGLVFESGSYRVLAVGGAIVRDHGGGSSMYRPPPVSASDGVVLVGVADVRYDGYTAIAGSEPTTVTLETDVTHDRRDLGEREVTVAVETSTPGAWERHFEGMGAAVERERFDGDEHPSVVATFEGSRTAYLVVHHLELEVRHD